MSRTRENVSAMIRAVEAGDDYVIQSKSGGKPLAICIPYETYEQLIAGWSQLQLNGQRGDIRHVIERHLRNVEKINTDVQKLSVEDGDQRG